MERTGVAWYGSMQEWYVRCHRAINRVLMCDVQDLSTIIALHGLLDGTPRVSSSKRMLTWTRLWSTKPSRFVILMNNTMPETANSWFPFLGEWVWYIQLYSATKRADAWSWGLQLQRMIECRQWPGLSGLVALCDLSRCIAVWTRLDSTLVVKVLRFSMLLSICYTMDALNNR